MGWVVGLLYKVRPGCLEVGQVDQLLVRRIWGLGRMLSASWRRAWLPDAVSSRLSLRAQ